MFEALKTVLVPIHKEGYPFIATAILVTLLFLIFFPRIGLFCFIITLWMIYFFRDPDRIVPIKDGLIISPADGMVQMITEASYPPEAGIGDNKVTRISIFLNVFNVHVNRIPIEGKIAGLDYFPGKFLNASLDKASTDNERQTVVLEMKDGRKIVFVQIAGLVARRIVCNLKPGQEVKTGERFGIIRFGSRMDVYLPEGINPSVVVGQQAIGGETILADITTSNEAMKGEKR